MRVKETAYIQSEVLCCESEEKRLILTLENNLALTGIGDRFAASEKKEMHPAVKSVYALQEA
jgi:hypothetical protein